MFFLPDKYYFLFVIPAMLWAMWAQTRVSSTFGKYERMLSRRGLTAAQAARNILDENGLRNIRIERVRGKLTDHYDPNAGVIRLSDSVMNSTSVAAIGVAAHECGHAVQHAQNYSPLIFRNAIIPVTNFGSKLAIPLFLVGLFISQALCTLGLVLFSLTALFQLVTLPVEFNASARALRTLEGWSFLDEDELRGAKRVLSAAAMTYVAALAVSVAQLARLMMIAAQRNRRD